MKLTIVTRKTLDKGYDLNFKVLFKCLKCKKEVEPDELRIGRAHIYALHCGVMQDVGILT